MNLPRDLLSKRDAVMNRSRNASLFQAVLAFCTLATGTMAIGDETKPLPEQVTIERALSFVQADAVKWRQVKWTPVFGPLVKVDFFDLESFV